MNEKLIKRKYYLSNNNISFLIKNYFLLIKNVKVLGLMELIFFLNENMVPRNGFNGYRYPRREANAKKFQRGNSGKSKNSSKNSQKQKYGNRLGRGSLFPSQITCSPFRAHLTRRLVECAIQCTYPPH